MMRYKISVRKKNLNTIFIFVKEKSNRNYKYCDTSLLNKQNE